MVTIGFFGMLTVLLFNGLPHDQNQAPDSTVVQIINITVGALAAAFATVVSFWLGSSQGSRIKDVASIQLQAETARQTSAAIETQAKQTEKVLQSAISPDHAPRGAFFQVLRAA